MSRNPLFSRNMAGIVSVILLTFFLFSLSTANAAPFATTIVSPATPNGWIWGLESGTNGSVTFVTGPTTPPAGTGSARFQTGNNTTGVALSRNGIYPGLRFDDITTLTYDLYKASGSSATNDLIFQINVDYNLTDANTGWQGRLVYEPYYFSSLPPDTWTSLNPLTDGAGWWATGAPGNGVCPISNPCTWTEVVAAFPNAGVQTGTLAAIHFKAGAGWVTPFNGNVDNLHIMADGGIDDTYDFDNSSAAPGPACTTTCYVSPLGSDTNGGASVNDPLRNIQTGVTNVSVGGTVVVAPGTYFENISIPKALTLDGAGAGTNATIHTIVDGTLRSGNGITLGNDVANITVQELRVQGFGSGSGIKGTRNNNVTIQGVHTYNNNNVAANLSANGGIYLTGPISDVTINGNESGNNTGRGIVIWDGNKQDITITNNIVAAVNCCGIELQDGTASGVTATGNTVTGNADSGMAFIGLQVGAGANLIANNTVNISGRFGIEIKLPNGTGQTSGDGSIVVENNIITGNSTPTDLRDTAGISVYRRGYSAANVDIPTGVIVRNNTITGYQQPSTSDGFGIVVEGVNHQVLNNTVTNNDIGVQVQGGHLPYTPNGADDGNQNNLADLFFGRGNAPIGCAISTGNSFTGNGTNSRFVGTGGFVRATNLNTSETFCTIQAAINDTNTLNGHIIAVEPGVHNEAVLINKSITLQGAGSGTTPSDTVLDGTSLAGSGITVANGITNVTIENLRVQNFASGSGIYGIAGNNGLTVQDTALFTNNTTNAMNGGGIYMNGPVDDVLIDRNTVSGNKSRGIVIWNGFKTNITITNNTVANNDCCGIELQDGTASGVTATGNIVTNNTDSGMAFIGLQAGAGPNLIANNTVSGTGRFGIEIKLPNGSGSATGDGSIVVEDNIVTLSGTPANNRDLAGISVYRRGWVSGNGNVDIPTGVILRDNTVNGYQQPSTSDGFGIVVEGVNHQVTNNILNNNDVGVQSQGGHLPYTPNSNIDGDQSNLADQYFGRGNAPIGCPVTIAGNTFAGNATDTRFVGAAGGYRATNVNTSEQFCTIQAAIDDADTLDGHTIQVVAGTHIEQLVINKAITLEGVQAGVPAKDRVGAQSILRWSGSTPPISLSDDNITIDGFVLNGQGATTSWIINGVGEPNNGVYNNISILNNEFIGDAGPHTAQNDPGGVYMIAATNTLFEGNYFNELGSHAVFMGQTSDGTTYRNNDSYRNYLSGFSAHNGSHTNVVIENNRSDQDSMILFNLDGAVIQNNVFTATATISARIYLGGGSSTVTVNGNHFNGSRAAAMSIFDAGFGYGGNSNVTVTDNVITATVGVLTFTDVGLIDLRDTTGTNLVRGNVVTMQGGTLGVNSVRGISLRNNMGTTMITANTLIGNNVDNSPATPSSGVFLESSLSATSNTTIRNNVIQGWNSGVTGGNLAAGLTATVYENDLSGNNPNAAVNGAGAMLNASANWYGTNTPPGVDALVSTNVDYTPWFDVGTDTSGTAGWQGDFSWFNADDNSPQTGSTGRINEAITLVTTGGTVNLAAGTYNETTSIPKSLTLQGAGAGTNPATHTILEGFTPVDTVGNGITIASGVTNVTVQSLRIQNFDLDGGFVAGIYGSGDNSNITVSGVHLYGNNRNAPFTSQGGGIHFANGTNGPSDITITASEAVTNTGRGITLWIGARENVTITNNLVNDNSIVGIDLSGGTSEGVVITGNTVTENGDSGIAVSGLQAGDGASRIATNTVTNNGRFGIEVKMPNGNGTDTGDGSIVIEGNIVSLTTLIVATEQRDLAGIAVFRRDYVTGNADIPIGVIVRNNTVSGYQQSTVSEGFGIVVEGVNHQVTTNTLNNNDVGVQVQGGHLPYTPNTGTNGDQSNLNDQFFGRGNAPYGCAAVTGNIFSGNTTNTRSVGNGGSGIRATNTTTLETFCTIQAAIDDANTVAGHTIEVAAGTFEEQVEVNKAITLEGQGEGVTTIVAPLDMPDFFNSGADNNYPIIYVYDVNATIRDLTVDGDGRGNLNYRFFGVAFEQAGGTLENVTITGMTETPFNGNQHGSGIWGRANNGTARTLTVTNVTITDFQKNGTVFTGANLTVTMDDSTVVGSGPLGLGFPAQNGIQLSGGAAGSFDNNAISDIVYTPATFAAAGYLLSGASGTVNVTNSDITNTTTAAYYINTQGNLTDNTIVNTPAGMGSAVYWWGAIFYNTTAAPLTAEDKPALPNAVDTGDEATVPEGALLNRSYTIEGNTFTGGGGGDGLSVYADAPEVATVTINENSVDDWAVGVYLDGAGTLNATVTANSVTNNDVGIQSERGTVSITNNVIDNNGTGILVSGAGTIAPTIYQNSIVSTGLGVNKTAAGIALVNASANWWGTNTPAGVAGELSAGVDYTPWFNVGTDTNGAAGWQGDFSWFNADDDSPQTGAVGRINEAITLVTVSGTVNLAAGTYNETASVPKSLTLQGAGATTILDGNTPVATTGNGITLNSGITNVTIQDLRVQDYGGAAPGGSGIFGTLSNHNTIVRRTELVNNNLSNVANGGGLYMNGPVNNVTIDDNDAVNNRSRGIVIWNGLKTNITITNNYVANNICCGIELQDGTASGVTVTGNIVENNGDSGMAFIGLQGGSGANLIANNTVTNNGRFGIEIKLPNGNGATSGDGSIVIANNTVSRNVAIPGAEQRDLAGISVYRRGWLAGNVDIPVGVIVRNNTVSGYAQPTTSDGFGIVVEGTNHQVTNNTLNNNDVGVQVQGGHLPYTPNTNIDGDQSNLNDQFFGRGNAPLGCAISTGNVFSGNTTNTRSVGNAGDSIRATNTNTLEQFCTIQSAIDDADTVNTHTIAVAAGTWEEQLEVPKSITLQGAGQASTIIRSPVTLTKFFVTSANNYPVIYIHDTATVTVADLTVDGAGRGNGNARFIGIGYRNAGGAVNNVTVRDVRETPISGNQSGIGIYAFADNGTARTLSVNNATIFGFQKNGTAFNGANLTATMSNSTVTGAGPINFNAQNGIQLAFGANGSFTNNTISNVGYTPTTDNASGYLLYQASGTTSITGSDLEDVEVGAYAYDSAMTFNGNTVTQTTAGMTGMPTWFGVFIASDVPAPLAPNATVQPVEDGGMGGSANAMMNRAHTLNGNTMTSEGRVGTAIGMDVDALEVTSLNILTNTLSTWDVGIEFDGDGLLAAMVDDSYIYDNAVGVVIRTGVISILNGAITEGGVGVRYFDSDGISPQIHGNDIDYNSSWGVEHATFASQSTPTIVDATNNYWGDPTGPLDTHAPNDAPCTTLTEFNPLSNGNPVTECVRWYIPLSVMLANFEATARANDILVAWETASETDNLGFNLYRATTPDGTPVQLNGELIPSQAPGGGGAMYEWEDVNVEAGVTYFYWLEAVDVQGNGSPYFGPVSATYGAPTAVTLSDLNAQPAILPMLLAAGFLIFGMVGMVIVRRHR